MKTVVIVEDILSNRLLVRDIFEMDEMPGRLVEFDSAESTLASMSEVKPDLILMDIALPGMDGLDAVKRLKNCDETRHVPVWALTAHAMKGDREAALDAGCDEYITKPINSAEFGMRLRRFLANTEQKEAA